MQLFRAAAASAPSAPSTAVPARAARWLSQRHIATSRAWAVDQPPPAPRLRRWPHCRRPGWRERRTTSSAGAAHGPSAAATGSASAVGPLAERVVVEPLAARAAVGQPVAQLVVEAQAARNRAPPPRATRGHRSAASSADWGAGHHSRPGSQARAAPRVGAESWDSTSGGRGGLGQHVGRAWEVRAATRPGAGSYDSTTAGLAGQGQHLARAGPRPGAGMRAAPVAAVGASQAREVGAAPRPGCGEQRQHLAPAGVGQRPGRARGATAAPRPSAAGNGSTPAGRAGQRQHHGRARRARAAPRSGAEAGEHHWRLSERRRLTRLGRRALQPAEPAG